MANFNDYTNNDDLVVDNSDVMQQVRICSEKLAMLAGATVTACETLNSVRVSFKNSGMIINYSKRGTRYISNY